MKNTENARDKTATHRFAVGQIVQIKGGIGNRPAETYQITAILPPKKNSPQYRIRNNSERHERVIVQDLIDLAESTTATSNDILIENTFGKPGKPATISARRDNQVQEERK